ncbi:MAG: pseudouridylate synthase [Saccharolobus sp.]
MKNSSEEKFDNQILQKAIAILSKYPLCDNCLGRCFARLGYGLTNKERGRAIKTLIILYLDNLIKTHQISDLSSIKEIIYNMGSIAEKWFSLYFSSEFQNRKCYLCEDRNEEVKQDFLNKAINILSGLNKKYVLGVELDDKIRKKENDFVKEFELLYYESIKYEIKREVGKALSEKGYKPDIDNPEVELIYNYSSGKVYIIQKNTKVLYIYNRLSRNIPISSWNIKSESLYSMLKKKIIFSFSEPLDIRILADYPIVIENESRNSIKLVGYNISKVMEIGKREYEAILNSKPSMKKYRVTLYSKKPINDGIMIYDNLYDLYLNVKSFTDLKEKLNKIQTEYDAVVLTIDLIDVEGRIKNIIETYVKSF